MKDIHQKISKAFTTGTMSWSGIIIYEFFDKLVTISGGSANSKPLGLQSDDCANNGGYDDLDYDNEELMGNGDPAVDWNEIKM